MICQSEITSQIWKFKYLSQIWKFKSCIVFMYKILINMKISDGSELTNYKIYVPLDDRFQFKSILTNILNGETEYDERVINYILELKDGLFLAYTVSLNHQEAVALKLSCSYKIQVA